MAPEYCADVRVYVLDRPFFNAAAAPNGYVEVWSGTLLRARNEAELAFVIGHEVSHVAQDHLIKSWRAAKTRANTAMALSVVASIALGAATTTRRPGISSFNSNMPATLARRLPGRHGLYVLVQPRPGE